MPSTENGPTLQEAIFAEAKVADVCALTEAIMESGLAEDHSTDGDSLWEAAWESGSPWFRNFELSHGTDEEGQFCYWLETSGTGDDPANGTIGFDPEAGTFWEVIDSEEEASPLYHHQDPGRWVELEHRFFSGLITAPVIDHDAPINDRWAYLYDGVMESLADEMEQIRVRAAIHDPEIVSHVNECDPHARLFIGREQRKRRAELKDKHGLNARQLSKVFELVIGGGAEEI
jgi:hypothetical protein